MIFELGILIRTSILWICTAVLAAALRKSSASARHALWMIAMLGSLVLPLASLLIPAVELPLAAERVVPLSAQTPSFPLPLTGFSFSREN